MDKILEVEIIKLANANRKAFELRTKIFDKELPYPPKIRMDMFWEYFAEVGMRDSCIAEINARFDYLAKAGAWPAIAGLGDEVMDICIRAAQSNFIHSRTRMMVNQPSPLLTIGELIDRASTWLMKHHNTVSNHGRYVLGAKIEAVYSAINDFIFHSEMNKFKPIGYVGESINA